MQIDSVIFGFGYKKRSGKDTAVEAIIEAAKDEFSIKRYSFADALKDECRSLACNLVDPRPVYQFWGDYIRSLKKNYWLNIVAQKIAEEKPEIALISDLRYKNEFDWIKEHGEVVKVVRPGSPLDNHISETELDSVPDSEWSVILTNDGSLEEFRSKAVQTFDELLTKFPYGCNAERSLVN